MENIALFQKINIDIPFKYSLDMEIKLLSKLQMIFSKYDYQQNQVRRAGVDKGSELSLIVLSLI